MHLHIWNTERRGKGIGGRLFCLSAIDFFERFEVREIVCEPGASNPYPNRMLQKIGFPLTGSRGKILRVVQRTPAEHLCDNQTGRVRLFKQGRRRPIAPLIRAQAAAR
jgi:hypothetical protein